MGKLDIELDVLVELEVGYGVYAGPEQCLPLLESRVKYLERARRRFDCDTGDRLCDLFLRDLNASMFFGPDLSPIFHPVGSRA